MGLFGGGGLGGILGGAGMGFLQGGPMGALIGGGMSALSGGGKGGGGGMFGGGGGGNIDMSEARKYLDQIPGVAKQYYEPFAKEYGPAQQEAKDVYNRMLEQYSSPKVNYQNVPEEYNTMARNPSGFLNDIMKTYEPSTGYKFKEGRMGSAARNTAASGGFAGTQYDQEQQAQLIKDLLGEDMQQYLTNVMGAKTEGLGGMERMMGGREKAYEQQAGSAENRAKRAYEATNELAQSIMNSLGNQGQLGFQGARQSAANRGQERAGAMSLFGDTMQAIPSIVNRFGGGGNGGWFNTANQGGGSRFGGGMPNTGFSGMSHVGGYLR